MKLLLFSLLTFLCLNLIAQPCNIGSSSSQGPCLLLTSNQVYFQKFLCLTYGEVETFHLFFEDVDNGALGKMALYTDNNDEVGSLVVESEVAPMTTGPNELEASSIAHVSPGEYWIAFTISESECIGFIPSSKDAFRLPLLFGNDLPWHPTGLLNSVQDATMAMEVKTKCIDTVSICPNGSIWDSGICQCVDDPNYSTCKVGFTEEFTAFQGTTLDDMFGSLYEYNGEGVLESLFVNMHAAGTGDRAWAVYEDDDGQIGNIIAGSVTSLTAGWNELILPAPTSIGPGKYWVFGAFEQPRVGAGGCSETYYFPTSELFNPQTISLWGPEVFNVYLNINCGNALGSPHCGEGTVWDVFSQSCISQNLAEAYCVDGIQDFQESTETIGNDVGVAYTVNILDEAIANGIGVFVDWRSPGFLGKMALYDDDGTGFPGDPIWVMNSGQVMYEGINKISLPDISLSPGTYHIAMIGNQDFGLNTGAADETNSVLIVHNYANAWPTDPFSLPYFNKNASLFITFDCVALNIGSCITDLDNNGLINTSDLLILLADYGGTCD